MPFLELKVSSFRNLSDASISINAKNVVLSGENGQGKTNFLEALYILSYGASFRTKSDEEISANGCPGYALEARVRRDGISGEIRVGYRNKAKAIVVDGKTVRDRKQLVRDMPCIVFSHADLEFATGSHERRRWFMDQSLSLLDPSFLETLRSYKAVARSRNTALKARDAGLLDVYDRQLAGFGLDITRKRLIEVGRFNEILSASISRSAPSLSGVEFSYAPSWDPALDESAIEARLKDSRSREIALCQCLSGPHRDRFTFMRKGIDLSRYASMGQVRMLAIAMRVAQARYLSSMTGRKAVLLLDDVLLELDARRRAAFLADMPEYDQAFFTFLPGYGLDGIGKGESMEYHVVDGRFEDQIRL